VAGGKAGETIDPGEEIRGCAMRGGDDVVDRNLVPLERGFFEYIALT